VVECGSPFLPPGGEGEVEPELPVAAVLPEAAQEARPRLCDPPCLELRLAEESQGLGRPRLPPASLLRVRRGRPEMLGVERVGGLGGGLVADVAADRERAQETGERDRGYAIRAPKRRLGPSCGEQDGDSAG